MLGIQGFRYRDFMMRGICMYVCIYIYIHTYIHTYTHAHTHIYQSYIHGFSKDARDLVADV